MKEQLLDSMDIERERGITIKANTVRIDYTGEDGEQYVLNLIDTPGHVDFAYEVSRSMRAVEGSLLVVDAPKGSRRKRWPTSIRPSRRTTKLFPSSTRSTCPPPTATAWLNRSRTSSASTRPEPSKVSAKTGVGIQEVLEAIVTRLPAPQGDRDAPLKACWSTAGMTLPRRRRPDPRDRRAAQKGRPGSGCWHNSSVHHVDRLGVFRPAMEQPVDSLGPGEIGFLTASIKQVRDTRVGDTITHETEE